MMSSQSMQTFIDPVFRRKMPLFDRTIASKGLSKNPNMADFQSKQTLQYSGAYFTHDPREKDAAGFTPWSNSNISLLDGRSPANHHSGIEGQNHNMFSQDSKSSEDGHSHSSSLRHAPIKQSFTLYNKGAGIISPTAASVDDRKQKTVGENSSPPSENSVYLAFPKPVYGQTPCCNELGCVLAQRYSVEHGCPRIPNTVFEHEWMQTDAPNAGRPSIQRKSQNTLLQQRDFQFESSAEQLKRANVKMYSPGRARTLPAMIQPTYSGYPCTLTHTLFGPLSEQSQRLQTSPRGYTSLYPSHPTYEHMTSEVYQEHSPMSKYGQLTQHPMFYYPQANVEVEKRTLCKDIGIKQSDVPVILKHTIPTPPKHYIVPQNLHGEITLPSETLANQSFMRGFDYACYAVPRLNINASQMRTPLKRQHASPRLRPKRINVSASRQFIDPPMASSTNTHKDKAKASLYVDLTQPHSPVLLMDKTSPYRRISQPVVSPSNIHMNRYNPPLTDMRRDHTVLPPNGLDMDRPLDYSFREARVTCLKQSEGLHVSTGAWLTRSPHDSLGRLHTAVTNGANFTKNMPSPAVAPENEHNGPVSSSRTTVLKGHMKRSFSHSSSPIKMKEEYRDLLEVELVKKRQKLEKKTDCPPMPVIGKVFSLAPYQAYLQASGVVFPGKVPQKTTISSEHGEVKTMLDTNKKRPNQEEQQQVACLASREICTPAEKPIVKVIDPKNIKVEKVDPSDTDNSVETPRGDYTEVKIKKEPEETDSSNSGPMLVIKKCEPDELESKPLVAQEKEISAESKPGEVTALIDSSSQGDTCTLHKQGIPLLPKPITPPQAPERKLNFKNIPPQCLKLSTYKIVLRDTEHCSPAPPPELITKFIPKLDFQMPVRKHFLELHQSLCKLLSESVLASSEQELKNWLSQLKLTEPASPSNKVPKVSCLLGQEARRVWLSEEMKTALNKLLQRLREYTAQDRCPFPHVMRTGAVFLPMLVVKELLFPLVQGSFIDQVLQEHKVELRPTTLSEEKILIQLHKLACSSKLRRLMSLRHLPDIYPDVVNLLYYTCVCKHLGLEMDDPDREKAEGCEGTVIFRSCVFSDNTASPASPASPAESRPEIHQNERETKSNLNKSTTKSRVKSSSRRLFLDDSLSGEEEADDTDKASSGGVPNAYSDANWSRQESDGAHNRGSEWVVSEQDSSLIPLSTPCENSWTCPIALDELSPSPSDTETEASSSPRPVSWLQGITKSPVGSNNSSGVILKLRRIFSKGPDRKKARYQANCDSGTFADPSLSQTDDREGEMVSEMDLQRRTPKVTHRWQRTGSFSRTLRPLSGNSKRKRRSLLKIKYCPYLSACHSAEHRRRWVLRSAVQRAQRAMRFFYPDLVGKKIRHLYEEDDKSEVWYRGEVLRIHEANANPLKTLFEVRYDSEPEWKYYLELLIDYKKGWLKIED